MLKSKKKYNSKESNVPLKNISKAYDVCQSSKPRDMAFKKLLNLGIWEAKIALKGFLSEQPYDSLSLSDKELLKILILEGISDHG